MKPRHTNPGRLPAQPMSFEATRRLYRERFDSHEFWMIIMDSFAGSHFLGEIERFYQGEDKADDFQAFVLDHGPHEFCLIAARKRHLRASQMVTILGEMAKKNIQDRQILTQDVLICAVPLLLETATAVMTSTLDVYETGPLVIRQQEGACIRA